MSQTEIENRIFNAVYLKIKKEMAGEIMKINEKIKSVEKSVIEIADIIYVDRQNKKEQMQLSPINQQQIAVALQQHNTSIMNLQAQVKELVVNGEDILHDYHQTTLSRSNKQSGKKNMKMGDTYFDD